MTQSHKVCIGNNSRNHEKQNKQKDKRFVRSRDINN